MKGIKAALFKHVSCYYVIFLNQKFLYIYLFTPGIKEMA